MVYTKEQLQKIFKKAFEQLSDKTKQQYPISITDLITDLWMYLPPELGEETNEAWEE
jgi:hypothetical protein